MKHDIPSIAEKNRTVHRVTEAITRHTDFLLIGHQNPDDDCIGSMVAMGLLIQRFSKRAYIQTAAKVGAQHRFLLEICRYNSIGVNTGIPWDRIAIVVACDTAKPELLDVNGRSKALLADPGVLKIEVDHHLGHDSAYIGDEGYRLVMEASSSAEIIGYLAYKISKRGDLLEAYQIEDMFPRNFVLSVITGLVGDTNLGQFLESPRVERSYHFFSRYYNRILRRKTVRLRNYSSQEELFNELGALSSHERACFDLFVSKAQFHGGVGYRAVDRDEIERDFGGFGDDTIANTSRAAADSIAEIAGKIGVVAYWDRDEASPYIQCRARRKPGYRSFDLRDMMELCDIENGGGHPGAIGFRVPKSEIGNVSAYVRNLASTVGRELP